MPYDKEFKPTYRYTAQYDSDGNYTIEKNGMMVAIYHGEFGERYFDRKISDLHDEGINVENML